MITRLKEILWFVTDGTAVLGLGNIGASASIPVMEGKAVLFKSFAGINGVPIALDTKDTEEIIRTVKLISPNYGGINLEDISAPRCFEIEDRLKKKLIFQSSMMINMVRDCYYGWFNQCTKNCR